MIEAEGGDIYIYVTHLKGEVARDKISKSGSKSISQILSSIDLAVGSQQFGGHTVPSK